MTAIDKEVELWLSEVVILNVVLKAMLQLKCADVQVKSNHGI